MSAQPEPAEHLESAVAVLNSLSRIARTERDFEEALRRMAERFIAFPHLDQVAIFLRDAGGRGDLELVAHSGLPPALSDAWARLGPGEDVAGRVLETQRPVYITDVGADENLLPATRHAGVKCLTALPLRFDHMFLGVVVASHQGPLGLETGEVLSGLVTQIALAADRWRLETDLRQLKAVYRDLAANVTELVLQADLKGRVTFANPAACDTLGYAPQRLLELGLDDLLLAESYAYLKEAVDRLREGKELEQPLSMAFLSARGDRHARRTTITLAWSDDRPAVIQIIAS